MRVSGVARRIRTLARSTGRERGNTVAIAQNDTAPMERFQSRTSHMAVPSPNEIGRPSSEVFGFIPDRPRCDSPPYGATAGCLIMKPPRPSIDCNPVLPLHLLNLSVRRSTIGRLRRWHLRPMRIRSARQRSIRAFCPPRPMTPLRPVAVTRTKFSAAGGKIFGRMEHGQKRRV